MNVEYQTPDESKAASIAYHLVPEPEWRSQETAPTYVPAAFGSDGFIHCTNGLAKLVDVANMFYQDDDRPYLVLVLDTGKIAADVRYDDPEQLFPHIYGPLNVTAVIGKLAAQRAEDGRFLRFRPVEG